MFWSILTLSILVKFNSKVCLAIKPVLIITLLLVIANSSEYIAIIGEKNKVKNELTEEDMEILFETKPYFFIKNAIQEQCLIYI